MSRPVRLAAVGTIIVALLSVGTGSPGSADGAVRLLLKGRRGETYQHLLILRTRTIATPPGAPLDVALRAIVETSVEAVDSRGRLTLVQRIPRFWARSALAGEVKLEFDSAKPKDVQAARADPELRLFVDVLSASVRGVQEPTGQIRSYTLPRTTRLMTGVDAMLEQMMTQGHLALPEREVRPGDTWDGGTLRRPIAGIGQMEITSTYAMVDVKPIEGDRVASISGTDRATLARDEEVGTGARLIDFVGESCSGFSITRGRVRTLQRVARWRIEYVESGQRQVVDGFMEMEIDEEAGRRGPPTSCFPK